MFSREVSSSFVESPSASPRLPLCPLSAPSVLIYLILNASNWIPIQCYACIINTDYLLPAARTHAKPTFEKIFSIHISNWLLFQYISRGGRQGKGAPREGEKMISIILHERVENVLSDLAETASNYRSPRESEPVSQWEAQMGSILRVHRWWEPPSFKRIFSGFYLFVATNSSSRQWIHFIHVLSFLRTVLMFEMEQWPIFWLMMNRCVYVRHDSM